MKTALLTLTLRGPFLLAKSQDTSVELSTFGVQTGVLGIWFYNEVKLPKNISDISDIAEPLLS
ncbi:hypothetical protein [Marivirga harenae]|uniref:hypothetical protein n=1 Tax=Marivirga harenae TaxID=2010992 RepID=UPI0026DF0DCA|nr:hypothetical protein [Marivirga harenae]WKV10611.1 hypothetical protein Q3Y49_10330 [Marivirga harenae]